MNKQARKLKEKRRALRKKEQEERINKIWNEFKTVTNNQNLTQDKNLMRSIYKTIKTLDNKSILKSGVLSLVISLLILKNEYKFNKQDLVNYAINLRKFINQFTLLNKPINDFIYEIENDYQIDINNRFEDLDRLTLDTVYNLDDDELIIKITIDNIKYFMAIAAYSFMDYLSYFKNTVWNSNDLEKFINEFTILYKNLFNDVSLLNKYNDELYNIGVYIDLNNGNLIEIGE